MNRRSFITSLAAVFAVRKMLFAAKPSTARWELRPPLCACCEKTTKDSVILYDLARFGTLAKNGEADALDYESVEWGQTTTLCRECDGHRGLLKARRYANRPHHASILGELITQEGEPTPEGFYRPFPTEFTFLHGANVDPGVLPLERPYYGETNWDVRACACLKPLEWAIIPNYGGNRAVSF